MSFKCPYQIVQSPDIVGWYRPSAYQTDMSMGIIFDKDINSSFFTFDTVSMFAVDADPDS